MMINTRKQGIGLELLKYLYLIFYLVLFLVKDGFADASVIVLMLCYLINVQLRIFVKLSHFQRFFTGLSVLLEFVPAFFLFKRFPLCGGALFLPGIMDLILEFSLICPVLYIMAVQMVVALQGDWEVFCFAFLEIVPVFLLVLKIREQESGKRSAEDLYDELRKKEAELKEANAELEAYASTVEEIAVLRERNRLSREIHDNVGHALSTMIIQLNAAAKLAGDKKELSALLTNLSGFAKAGMEDVRCAVRAMKPREFEENEEIVTVSELIKNFEKLTGISVRLRVSDKKWKLNSDQAAAIYRIIQEFLSNALRHGKATKVKVYFNFEEERVRIYLKDNGRGCDHVVYGVGLKSMQERLAILGGSMEYQTKAGEGFALVILLEKGKLSIDG